MSIKSCQVLIYTVLSLPVLAQGLKQTKTQVEIISPTWNRDEVKPGKAYVLVEENDQFSVRKAVLKVKHIEGASEDEEGGYVISANLTKNCKVILAWRNIPQIKVKSSVLHVPLPPAPEQFSSNVQVRKIKDLPVEFLVECPPSGKQKVIIRINSVEQTVYDSSHLFSGSWWPIWCGDLDGDGKLDFISEDEGGSEYVQGRTITLWLSSIAKENELLGIAGKRLVFVGGD